MKHIKKFNENISNETEKVSKGFTVGELKELIKDLSDDCPVLLINPVGKGSSEYVKDNISVEDVLVSDNGIGYTKNMSQTLKDHKIETTDILGLVIYEG